ncbi:MAG: hypothetical protein ACSHW7_06385 [Patiriisocius sp.]|uniref:hypothetical protein n=1 Tax=Patiriisocius sp. TaxID=2822396 RepID=UPI003EF29788
MAKVYRTPGVYVEEVSAFPTSIAQVETAIPAFIGYTKKAVNGENSIKNIPTKISSFLEYQAVFGGNFKAKCTISTISVDTQKPDRHTINFNGETKALNYKTGHCFMMYKSVKLFYENGGGTCFIISVGNYKGKSNGVEIKRSAIENGIQSLLNVNEPTLVVCPDAVTLLSMDCYSVYKKMLAHCAQLRNRFAIIDIHNGFQNPGSGDGDVIQRFRESTGTENLEYGAVY